MTATGSDPPNVVHVADSAMKAPIATTINAKQNLKLMMISTKKIKNQKIEHS
jgi:hypothetical protein